MIKSLTYNIICLITIALFCGPSTPLLGITIVAGVVMSTNGAVLVRPFSAILARYPLLPAPAERRAAPDTQPLLNIFVIPLVYLRFGLFCSLSRQLWAISY